MKYQSKTTIKRYPEPIFAKGLNENMFRFGQVAAINNMCRVGKRPCVQVRFVDGTTDEWPLKTVDIEWCFCDAKGRVLKVNNDVEG